MEDIPNPSQSDAEQPQPPANHNRPFFYVQPPSQPYFMYQWPMDPFGQYGFLGPVLPFGRPYMSPYQFMPYPGYVVPHAPMQSTDYRRVGPLFPSVSSYDLRFRQHFQQMSLHRETTSSEVQTEHGYPVSKLTGSQDSLKMCEKTEADKEPKVMFSTPGVISFTHEVDKMSYADELNIEPAPQINKVAQDKLINPVTLCDSAVYNGMSSQGHLEDCVLSDVLPLDSSSIRDEIQSYKRDDLELSGVHSAKSGTCPISNACHSSEGQDSGAHVSDCSGTSNLFESKSSIQNQKVENLSSDCVAVIEPLLPIAADCELPYQILRLPCNKTTTGLLLQKELDSLPYMDSSAILPSKHYAFGSTYSHNYYPHVVPARQSVLGPSLDELSSRDEMFSTDAEDEPPSGQICVDGGKLAEPSTVPIRSVTDPIDDMCSVWAKTCACCGASLPDEDTSPAELLDQDYDPELEEATDTACISEGNEILFVQHPFRHGQSPCAQVSKPKAKKLLEYAEPTGQDHGRGECAEQHHPAAKGGKGRGKAQLSAQFSSYSEHFQREGPAEIMEQANSTGCSGKQRSRSCKPANNQQEKGRPARRNPSSNALAQHRPRRNEYDEAEVSYCQRGRGSTKRRGTRY